MEPRNRTTYIEIYNLINLRKEQKPIDKKVLLNFLRKGLKNNVALQLPKYDNAIRLFGIFIKSQSVLLDEDLIEKFRQFIKTSKKRGADAKSAGANILHIINKSQIPENFLKLSILNGLAYKKFNTFNNLSQLTQEMFIYFEEHAKQIKTNRLPVKDDNGRISIYKEFQLLKKPLALIPRYNRLDRCLQFLKKHNKKCISEITINDFKIYCHDNSQILKELCPLFANLHAFKFIDTNPFCHFDYSPPRKKNDYIRFINKEGIDRLLFAVNNIYNCPVREVRALTLCLLAYDSCLREGEISSLRVNDVFFEDDLVYLRIRQEIQKGQTKSEKYIVLLFDETIKALKYYLKAIHKPLISDYLFQSNKGQRISYSATRYDINLMQKTYNLKINQNPDSRISAHDFRRTFATLNAPGIGLSLSLDKLADRLRHSNPDITRLRYISNNTYLQKHKLRNQLSELKNDKEKVFNEIDVIKVIKFLKSCDIPDNLLSQINYYIDLSKGKYSEIKYDLLEESALHELSQFNVKVSSFRKKCIELKQAKYNNECIYYNKDYISDIKSNYVLLKEALDDLCISRQAIENNKEFFKKVVFGKVTLISKNAISEYKTYGIRPQSKPF